MARNMTLAGGTKTWIGNTHGIGVELTRPTICVCVWGEARVLGLGLEQTTKLVLLAKMGTVGKEQVLGETKIKYSALEM